MTIHTHPNSFPPSVADLNSGFANNYVFGLIICHDGTIYQYSANAKVEELYYDLKVANLKKQGYNEIEAQKNAMNSLSKEIAVKVKEVMGNEIL